MIGLKTWPLTYRSRSGKDKISPDRLAGVRQENGWRNTG